MVVCLREIVDENRDAVLALRLPPEQERFVGSVRRALADAAKFPEAKGWYRAIYARDEPVGFVMVSWNIEPRPPDLIGPWFLWKLLIDHRHQGRGYGAEAVRQVTAIVRDAGATELLTSHALGDGNPGGFYERLGFEPTGEYDGIGEPVLRLSLAAAR